MGSHKIEEDVAENVPLCPPHAGLINRTFITSQLWRANDAAHCSEEQRPHKPMRQVALPRARHHPKPTRQNAACKLNRNGHRRLGDRDRWVRDRCAKRQTCFVHVGLRVAAVKHTSNSEAPRFCKH
eukprot:Amastigsp_a843054_36.p2 type:complete len:126 gc:universal Amastigsp_a843054_36:736-359(-)